MAVWLTIAILICAAGVAFYHWRSLHRVIVAGATVDAAGHREKEVATPGVTLSHIFFQTEATDALNATIYALAFGVTRIDYQIHGQHREVLDAAKKAVAEAVDKSQYFPRRPALLPKLLRALNSGDASREEIVRLILQDPVLVGNVLKRANSAYYGQRDTAIESIDRAVTLLGSEGLRAPVATAVLQPVFQLPRGFFDHFAPVTWELAQRTAAAAEAYARTNRVGDAFVAHLLGLLGGLGRIVLFRMTLDKYRSHNIMPRAEVFISVMMDHETQLTRAVASTWELSPVFLAAIEAQQEQMQPLHMTPLAKTLYYANLCGSLAVLCLRDKYSLEDAAALLRQQGLGTESFDSMWAAAIRQETA
jgi:HD-like signal output (HDOD) protein